MASWADQQFTDIYTRDAELFGTTVTIQRGHYSTDSVTAVVEMVDQTVLDSMGVETVIQVRQYEIALSDYVIGGTVREPRDGDEITETVGGTVQKFVVMPSGDKPGVEPLATDGVRWLVRTKRIE